MDNPNSDLYLIQDLHSLIWAEEIVIDSSHSSQCSDATNGSNLESILDIVVRLRERKGLASGRILMALQVSDLVRKILGSFDEVGVRIGMLHAT